MKLSWSKGLQTLVIVAVSVQLLPVTAHAQVRPNQWAFSINFQEVRRTDSNVNLPDNEFLAARSLGTALSFSRRTPRGQFSAFGRAAVVVFRDLRALDDVNYSGAFSGSRQLSPRTSFSFREVFSSGFDIARLTSIGITRPRLDAKSVVGAVGLSHRVSSRTSTFVRFSHNWTSFVSLGSIEASQFVLDTPFIEDEDTGLPPDEAGPAPGGGSPPPNGSPRPDGSIPAPPDGQDFVLDVLSSEGLEVPRLSSLFAGLTAGISTKLSSRTTASASLNYGRREFFDDSPGRASGPLYGGRAGISRRFGRNDRIFANYRYQRNDAPDPSTTTQTLSGGWGRRLGTQFRVSLATGASHYQTTRDDDPGRTTLFVTTGISYSRASTSFAARYRRSIRQALGFGRSFLTDHFAVNLAQRIGRRLHMGASAGYTLGEDLSVPDSRPSAFRYGGEVGYRVIDSISVGARYVFSENTRSRAGEESSTRRSLWSWFVSYGHIWQ